VLRGATKLMAPLLLCGGSGLGLAGLPPAPLAPAVADVLGDWQQHSKRVRLELPTTIGSDWLPAALAADALLRSLSAQPVAATDRRAAGTLRLTTRPLATSADLELAVVDAEPATLTLTAVTAEDLARTLIRLRQPVLQRSCNTQHCQIPLVAEPQRPPDCAERPDARQPGDSPAQVLSVGTLGYREGYTVRGAGRHVLAFSFQRPAHWQLEEWPSLRLFVDRSLHPALDAAASSIEVRLHGQSLGSFPLTARAGRGLLVSQPIPQSFWSLPSWDFEVVSTLASTSPPPASGVAAVALWLSLAPHSSLYVPRREPEFRHSLAAWHHRMACGKPRLRLDQPLPSTVLPRLGAALFPWSGLTPWRIAEPGTGCLPPCLELRIAYASRPSSEPGSAELAIAVEPGTSDAPTQAVITLWPTDAAPAPVASPQYAAVVTEKLQLSAGRFTPVGGSGRPLGAVRIRGPGPPPFEVTPLVRDRAAQRVQFDWAFGLLCLLSLTLGWLRSGPRSDVWQRQERS
jgi:hypothetical protein